MAIEFQKPDHRIDWEAATLSVAQLAIKTIGSADPLSTAKVAVSVYPTIKKFNKALKGKETNTLENLAYKWFSLALAETVVQFLYRLRKETILQASNIEGATQDFLTHALNIPHEAKFDALIMESPAAHPAFGPAKQGLGNLIRDVTNWTDWDIGCWQTVFDDTVSRSSQKVLVASYEEFRGLIEAVSGSAGSALRRDLAWERHYEWISQRFNLDPVFSPDGSVKTPLSDLYIHLRTYWHEEYFVEREDQREPEKRWKAHVGDLHDVIDRWLVTNDRQHVKVIAGGPGSGKSSFAKALASQVTVRGSHRVLFIEMQRLRGRTSDLYRDIASYFDRRHQPTGDKGSPGFPENPLEWAKTDNRPVLLIFDGLDEITHDTELAKEISRKFILNLDNLIKEQNSDGGNLCALVLGRYAACQEGLEAAGLPLDAMLNVAPIRKLSDNDLMPATRSHADGDKVDIPELGDQWLADQRPDYWEKWQRSQGLKENETPEAVTADALSDLNVEPLLLHLLILSDYCGDRWAEAAENRNLVYFDILNQIHKRNVDEGKAEQQFSKPEHFFLLMECLGLAAWHGNLRTGDESTFLAVREIHARSVRFSQKSFDRTDFDSMVLQTHARKVDGAEPGFEFIHKSFCEYLAARALVTIAQRTTRQMNNPDDPASKRNLALDWVELVGKAELTPELLEFLRDELKGRTSEDELVKIKSALERLLSWVEENGMPVSDVPGSFREQETTQRCAETALLAVSSSTARQLKQIDATNDGLKIGWNNPQLGPAHMFHRLFVTSGECSRLALGELALPNAVLTSINLMAADLGGANLHGAKLIKANLTNTNLSGANLAEANLSRASLNQADLTGADLRAFLENVDFTESNLREASLNGAYLVDADLRGADLTEADLREANLDRATLERASLINTDLSSAKLFRAYFYRATLTGADLVNANLCDSNLTSANLSRADLTGADLHGARLQTTKLDGANLSGANLIGANLREADLTGANLTGAELNGANLFEANLSGAGLNEAKLIEANLSATRLIGADLSGANLSSARLIRTDLSGACLTQAILAGAKLLEPDFSEADLSGMKLHGADLSRANLNNARLVGSDLTRARLMKVDFTNADLSGTKFELADLTDCIFSATSVRSVDFSKARFFEAESVNSIFGVRVGFGLTLLPENVEYPDFWHVAEEADEDSDELFQAYISAYDAWKAQH